MILEGIVTSRNQQGELNIAPMGPVVDPEMTRFVLRPFQTSRTFSNLKETRCGVLHVVDDVLLLAKAAIGRLNEIPATFPAEQIAGDVYSPPVAGMNFRLSRLMKLTHEPSCRLWWFITGEFVIILD